MTTKSTEIPKPPEPMDGSLLNWAILAAAGERYRRKEEERHKQWEMNQRLEEFQRERDRMEKRNMLRDLLGI